MITPKLRILSLGAGVQSTTLALMSACGELEPLDAAIFADTGWEPRAVYDHLAWLETVLPFPVIHASAGHSIRDGYRNAHNGTAKRYASLPLYTLSPEGERGHTQRQCTKEYKANPIGKARAALLAERGIKRSPGVVEQWIGISMDEVLRMKPVALRYVRTRWPLIEMSMTRRDCLRWLEHHDYPRPPKSSCVGCPFHSNGYWRELRATEPDSWLDAVAYDTEIRNGGHRGVMRGSSYLHADRVPLAEVDLSTPEQNGQLVLGDDFNAECEGLCGV